MKLVDEFKEFAFKGNVLDLAIGVIIGGAFGKIVSSLVADIIMPLIGLIIGGINFAELHLTLRKATIGSTGKVVPAVTLNYGNFIQTAFDFMIIAFCIFMIIKAINHVRNTAPPAAVTDPSEEILLLREIRNSLQHK